MTIKIEDLENGLYETRSGEKYIFDEHDEDDEFCFIGRIFAPQGIFHVSHKVNGCNLNSEEKAGWDLVKKITRDEIDDIWKEINKFKLEAAYFGPIDLLFGIYLVAMFCDFIGGLFR